MSEYNDLPEFLYMISHMQEYSMIKSALVAAADEITALRSESVLFKNNNEGDDPRNLLINIGVTEEVTSKEDFTDAIIDALMETCSCNGGEVDSAWLDRHTHAYITMRWTDAPR